MSNLKHLSVVQRRSDTPPGTPMKETPRGAVETRTIEILLPCAGDRDMSTIAIPRTRIERCQSRSANTIPVSVRQGSQTLRYLCPTVRLFRYPFG